MTPELAALRQAVWEANMALPANGLVRGTSGNASGRDPETGLVAIKPSGVGFPELTPDNLCIVDIDGYQVAGSLKPSVDTDSHLYVYRNRPEVGGVVHTHSPYATSFAIRGEPIKVFTTTAACIFGSEIPITDFAVIGEEAIGKEIVDKIGDGSAVLVRNHGVFTIGPNAAAALRAAIYAEEEAESLHLATLHGEPAPLSADIIQSARCWYLREYGQETKEGEAD